MFVCSFSFRDVVRIPTSLGLTDFCTFKLNYDGGGGGFNSVSLKSFGVTTVEVREYVTIVSRLYFCPLRRQKFNRRIKRR